jgi:hypothetical protein
VVLKLEHASEFHDGGWPVLKRDAIPKITNAKRVGGMAPCGRVPA